MLQKTDSHVSDLQQSLQLVMYCSRYWHLFDCEKL